MVDMGKAGSALGETNQVKQLTLPAKKVERHCWLDKVGQEDSIVIYNLHSGFQKLL